MRMKFDPERIKNLCKPGDYGIFNPPMDAQVALDELCHYLLGPDWYDSSGCTNREQINTEIVCQIEKRYTGAIIRDKERYNWMRGRVTVCELPVGTIFKVGGLYFKKITDQNVWSRLSRVKSNVICLDNGHRCTLLSSVWVRPVSIDELSNSGPEILFSDLKIGDKFRWDDVCGKKISDVEIPADWVKNPKEVPANFIDLVTGNQCVMSTHHIVIKLKE